MLVPGVLLLAGCVGASHVEVESEFPEPLISQLPLRMGVHLSDELRGYSHEEEIPRHSSWHFDLGAANVSLFQPLFGAMFDEVVPVSAIPPDSEAAGRLHGIVRPTLDRFEFDVPRNRNNKFVEVWVQYKLQLYTPEGGLVAEWPVTGYGKSKTSNFSQGRSLRDATVRAMREAGADLSIGFSSLPEVSDWLEDIGYDPANSHGNGASAPR